MRSSSSLIPAVLANQLDEFTRRLEFCRSVSDSVHLDVMDGEFVNKKSLVINEWPVLNFKYAEAHLMVRSPSPYLKPLKEKAVTRAIVHVESSFELNEIIEQCRTLDLLLGFAVNPDTDLSTLARFFAASGYIQIMGVFPGRTSQKQLPQTVESVRYLRRLTRFRPTISVDGGVNPDNVVALQNAGADYFVSSGAIYDRGDWHENFHRLKEAINDN